MLISQSDEVFEDFEHCVQMMGHVVDLRMSTSNALEAGLKGEQDLVVVRDHGDFVAAEFVREFREQGYCKPVLVMTGDNNQDSKIEALEAGADQVAGNNADCDEWAARVRSLLRNCDPQKGDTLVYEDVEIDLLTMTVTRGGKVLDLRGKPYSLLEFFMRNPEKVHSRERIGQSVWDCNLDLFSNVIDVTLSKLRARLDRGFDPPYLHTVVGSGYMLGKNPPGVHSAN